MTSPAVASVVTSTFATGTSVTLTKNASLTVGDLMVAGIITYNQSGVTVTPPSNNGSWTVRDTNRATSSDYTVLSVYEKIANAADVAATNFVFGVSPSEYCGGFLVRVTGNDAAPYDTSTSATSGASNNANVTAGGISSAGADELCLIFTTGYNHNLSAEYATYTKQATGDTVCYVHSKAVGSGAVGSLTATKSISDSWVTATLLYKAAAATPTGTVGVTLGAVTGAITGTVMNPQAVLYVKEVGHVNNTTGGTTSAITVAAGGVPVGDTIVIFGACDNTGASGIATTIAVADNHAGTTNVYSLLGPAQAIADPGLASAGQQGFFVVCPVTTALSAGDTITITYGNSTTAKAIAAHQFTGVNKTTPRLPTTYTTQDNQTGQAVSVTATPTVSGQCVVALVAVEGGTADSFTQDTDTTDGPWVTLPRYGAGTTTSGSTLNSAYKYINKPAGGPSAQTYNHATMLGTSRDHCAAIFVLDIQPYTGTVAQTLDAIAPTITGDVTGGATGTVGVTLGAVVPTITGWVEARGGVAQTLAAVAPTITGTSLPTPVTGTVVQTLGAVAPTISGTSLPTPVTGTIAQTLAAVTSSIAGTHTIPPTTGTVDVTLGAIVPTIAGWTTITGTVAQTLAAVAPTITGTSTPTAVTGTVAATLAAVTSSIAGTSLPTPVTGTVGVTLGAVVPTITGTSLPTPVTGTLAVTLAGVAPTITGTQTIPPVTGTVAQTLGAVTSSIAGTQTIPPVTGTVAATLADVTSSIAGTSLPTPVTGTVAQTLGDVAPTVAGQVTIAGVAGNIAVTLGPITSSIVGTHPIVGTVAVTLGEIVPSIAGTHTIVPVTGTVAVTLGPVTPAIAGTHQAPGVSGSVAATLGSITSSIVGTSLPTPVAGSVHVGLGQVVASIAGTQTIPPVFGAVAATLSIIVPTIQGSVAVQVAGVIVQTLDSITVAIIGTAGTPKILKLDPGSLVLTIGLGSGSIGSGIGSGSSVIGSELDPGSYIPDPVDDTGSIAKPLEV